MTAADVIVVGAGLAGLGCARTLARAGVRCLVLEASDAPGGRARTDGLDGFLLDRGFQVLLTAYPEAQAQLDLAALELQPFEPGALVFTQGAFSRVSDPWRRPQAALASALAPVGRIADKVRIAVMRYGVVSASVEALFARPEQSMLAQLRDYGFSPAMRDRFLRPFFGGIFLDPELGGSSRMMDFVFRMFSLGHGAVPRLGMGQIAAQLLAGLPEGTVRCSAPVHALTERGVRLVDGEELVADQVVLAVPGPEAGRLQGRPVRRGWRGVTNIYLAGDGEPPVREPILLLDGARGEDGPILNLAIMSNVSSSYAPAGRFLVSVSVPCSPAVGSACQRGAGWEDALRDPVHRQLERWFPGAGSRRWQHLRTYHIPEALPDQRPPWYTERDWPVRLDARLYRCGDWVDTASIDGALRSGRRAAEAVLSQRAHG